MADRLVRLDDVLTALRDTYDEFQWDTAQLFVEAAVAALVALPEAPHWQPIATAPKDGTPVRLKWDGTTVGAIGRWCSASKRPKPYSTDDWRDVKGDDVLLMPTHWTPLLKGLHE